MDQLWQEHNITVRDVYDVLNLSTKTDSSDYLLIKKILLKKAEIKNLHITGKDDFVNEEKRIRNKRAWEQSLSHQLQIKNLPAFDIIYKELGVFIGELLE